MNSGTISLTEGHALRAGVDDSASAIMLHVSGGSFQVTGVPIADIGTILALTRVPNNITVQDTAANIVADLAGSNTIQANTPFITAVAVSDVVLGVTTVEAVYDGLNGIVSFNESNLTISDTVANLLAAETTHAMMLSAAQAVTLSADATGVSAADATTLFTTLNAQLNGHLVGVTDSATNLLDPANFAGVNFATSVALNAPATVNAYDATLLVTLPHFNVGAQPITVADSPTNLLDAANATGIAAATAVTPDANYTVSGATLGLLAAIPTFGDGTHTLTLQDTVTNVLGLSAPVLALATQVDVADSAANVTANLGALQTLQTTLSGQSHTLALSVAGAVANTPIITVDAATYTADQGALDAVDTAGIIKVVGNATDLAALATTLHNDAAVGEVDVTDTANNILLNLPTLESIGAKFLGATISDATVTAAMVAQLLTIPNLQAGGLVVSDSGSQIAAAIAANGQAGLDFMNAQTVQLNQNSVVTAGDALTLEGLTGLQKGGYQLSVWDSATHLTDNYDGYLAAVSAGTIDAVYLRTPGGTATITASTASALFSIPNFDKSNPDTTPNVLTVQDTAAHIDGAYTDLSSHRAQIDNLVVSGSATITDATLGHLLSLAATADVGVNITVRDTAANIIANAPAQVGGSPTIMPVAWLLSGSATVDEAGAAFLGSLSGFSAGAYTLTLSADATIGVTDANAIGALGSSFQLGGYHLYLPGTVADMSTLSTAAKAIVVPQIADTFANIATLLPGSGVLGGTITVSDSEAVTVAQAAAFLALLQVGGGTGIPATNVHFGGHIEAVTDTLANIQTLTGTQAWLQNTSVQSDFSLVVADTVANLVDPANTAALSAMAGTTLSGNLTTTAADAEALFAVQNAIHFSLDSHTLTVQDTAANLLDPVNIDGVGLASVLTLTGPDTVSAAGAETLLANSHFQLGSTLTISDSSGALLDGVLSNAIAGSAYASNIHVELSAPETLDAQTAHRLVNLPGFTNNGDLSIQDSASYLLNANNHDAEVLATSVTLAGNETVSATTAVHLAAVPHFSLGSDVLHLASNDYADAATLKTIADFGTGFDPNGHTLTVTQDTINLTPTEYNNLQSDGLVANGHALSAIPTGLTAVETGGNVTVDGTGVSGATVTLYDASGGVLTTGAAAPAFTVTAADAGVNMSLTETIGGNAATGESAPVVLLDQASVETIVTGDAATFATSGAVHLAGSEYLDLYDAASAPANPANPALVYDATQHTLSLDVSGHAPVVLVTLGGATTAAHLDATEILVKHAV